MTTKQTDWYKPGNGHSGWNTAQGYACQWYRRFGVIWIVRTK